MRYIALILMLIAPSWATANERSFICSAKAAFGWAANSSFDSVGRVEVENQWLLSAIDEREIKFSDPEAEPRKVNYALKLLGEDEVKGYCTYISDDKSDYELASCFFLSEINKYKGSLSDTNTFWMEHIGDGINYQMIHKSRFYEAFILNIYRPETLVAYEQGSCKSF